MINYSEKLYDGMWANVCQILSGSQRHWNMRKVGSLVIQKEEFNTKGLVVDTQHQRKKNKNQIQFPEIRSVATRKHGQWRPLQTVAKNWSIS